MRHPRFLRHSIRVRFLGFGASSLELQVFAHLTAHDWAKFLDLQGEALLAIMEIVEAAGTRLALPSQTTYVTVSGGRPVSVAFADSSAAAPRPEAEPRCLTRGWGGANIIYLAVRGRILIP